MLSFKPSMPEPFPSPHPLHASLVRHTGYLVSRVGMLAQKRFAERMATLGLTTRMWGVLNVLEAEEPITQHALGKSIGTDPSSMVATIDELERQGLVQRRPHPSDRRAHALHMTAKGRRTLRTGRELAKEAQNELLAPLSAADRAQLHELLLALVTSAERFETPLAPVTERPPARA